MSLYGGIEGPAHDQEQYEMEEAKRAVANRGERLERWQSVKIHSALAGGPCECHDVVDGKLIRGPVETEAIYADGWVTLRCCRCGSRWQKQENVNEKR